MKYGNPAWTAPDADELKRRGFDPDGKPLPKAEKPEKPAKKAKKSKD
jgi:hypothetical protein